MSKKRFKIVATIYDKRGKVLSRGVNSYTKTHPTQMYYASLYGRPEQIYLHAEISAIIRLRDPTKAYSIKVERYNNEGEPVCAKPCSICYAAITKLTNIKEIKWT